MPDFTSWCQSPSPKDRRDWQTLCMSGERGSHTHPSRPSCPWWGAGRWLRRREGCEGCMFACLLTLYWAESNPLLYYLLCVSKQTFLCGWASPEGGVKKLPEETLWECYLKCWIAIHSAAFFSTFCPATMKFSCFVSFCNFAFTNARQILPM